MQGSCLSARKNFDPHSIIVWKKVSHRTEFFEAAFPAETEPQTARQPVLHPQMLTPTSQTTHSPRQASFGSVVARSWPRL